MASKQKQEYLTVQASTTQLLCTIREDRAYKWADNPQNRGRLESLLADMQEKLSDWDKEYITNPASSLRKKYNDARVLTELNNFVEFKVGSHAFGVVRWRSPWCGL